MGISVKTRGVVEIDGENIEVKYSYIDFHTIECETGCGEVFITHYKSLLVGNSHS